MAVDKSEWVVGKVIARQARARGDRPFMQFEDGRPYTYAEVHEIANRVGNAFAQAGVRFGENVAVMLHNRMEYLWTWFGLNRIGAVHVGINTAYKGMFLTHVLANPAALHGDGARVPPLARRRRGHGAGAHHRLRPRRAVARRGPPALAADRGALLRRPPRRAARRDRRRGHVPRHRSECTRCAGSASHARSR
jgi:hypothetical protein